jgi:predicted RNA binding protein YcfA (HicA-like mRNA interferase family)
VKHISGKDMCKVLERKGWRLIRVKSSHHHYLAPDRSRTVPVPVHGNRTLKPGTQHNIMRAAGLTDADL